MLCVRQHPPVDYSNCNQTVTVYHLNADKTVTRTLYKNSFLDFRKNQNVNKTGSTETNSFLLVIPCEEQIIFVEDKVLLGTGEDITTREQWAALIPVKVPGLVVVKYVDPKYWRGKMIHLEVGG